MSTISHANIIYHTRTSLGPKIGEVTLEPAKLFFNPQAGSHYGADRSMFLDVSIPLEFTQPLVRVISNSKTYQRYVQYAQTTLGHYDGPEEAPLYGHLQARLKSGQEIDRAARILRHKVVKVEVFEGTQDQFSYPYTFKDATPVLDAEECILNQNSPLWTLRFSAGGESFEFPYSQSRTAVSSIHFGGIGKKLFPATHYVQIKGADKCMALLGRIQNSSATYEFLYKEHAAKLFIK